MRRRLALKVRELEQERREALAMAHTPRAVADETQSA